MRVVRTSAKVQSQKSAEKTDTPADRLSMITADITLLWLRWAGHVIYVHGSHFPKQRALHPAALG